MIAIVVVIIPNQHYNLLQWLIYIPLNSTLCQVCFLNYIFEGVFMGATGKKGRLAGHNHSLIMIFIAATVMFRIISLPLTNAKHETVSKLRHQGQSEGLCSSSNKSLCVHRWAPLKLFVLHLFFFLPLSPSWHASWSSGEGVVVICAFSAAWITDATMCFAGTEPDSASFPFTPCFLSTHGRIGRLRGQVDMRISEDVGACVCACLWFCARQCVHAPCAPSAVRGCYISTVTHDWLQLQRYSCAGPQLPTGTRITVTQPTLEARGRGRNPSWISLQRRGNSIESHLEWWSFDRWTQITMKIMLEAPLLCGAVAPTLHLATTATAWWTGRIAVPTAGWLMALWQLLLTGVKLQDRNNLYAVHMQRCAVSQCIHTLLFHLRFPAFSLIIKLILSSAMTVSTNQLYK